MGWIRQPGPTCLRQRSEWLLFHPMSIHTIHIRSENPDLLIEFDLPPGTHATIGASPKSEVTLPLGGIPPFSCVIGRFHDGRLYLADLDGALSGRIDLPAILQIPPYHFEIFHPDDSAGNEPPPLEAAAPPKQSGLSKKLRSVLARFTSGVSPSQVVDNDGGEGGI